MNTNRLIQVLKWNIISNKKNLIRETLFIFAAFLVILIGKNFGCWLGGMADYSAIAGTASTMFFGIGVAMLVWASRTAFNMKTKTEFVNYAMLPATKGEKFLANVLYQTVLRIATVVVAMVLADIVQGIISFIAAGNAYSLSLAMLGRIGDLFVAFNGINDSRCLVIEADTFAMFILVHASYVFGGTFFRNHQFLYTSLFWLFGPMLIGSALGGSVVGFLAMLHNNGYVVSVEWLLSENATIALITVFIFTLAFGLYFLAYRYFCRSQIINNKFFN